MNSSNSIGFLVIGVAMAAMPMLAPQGFPPTGFDGTSARALWLEVVGGVQAVLGTACLLQIWSSRLIERITTVTFTTLDRSALPARAIAHARAA